MPQTHSKRSNQVLAAVLVPAACLAIAACGSSSSTKSTTTNAAATTSTSAKTPGAPGSLPSTDAKRFTALRECLEKNGVKLPTPTPGQHRHGGGAFLGGGAAPKLPAGVSRSAYEAAIKKCGGFPHGGYPGSSGNRFANPEAKKALSAFAACMRSNGINLPEPNTSGKGAIFDTKGIDINSTAFASAESKCRSNLRAAFKPNPATG